MKKQRAFTLIELLAVIVILAIISLIAIPIILNIIEKAKQSSLESSAKGLAESSKLYYFKNMDSINEEVVFDCNLNGCHNAKGEVLEFSGKIESGKLVLSEKGKALVCVDDGEKYAYIKETTTSGTGLCGDYEDEEITILDKTGKRNGRIILSGNTDKISYPNTKELEIITNLSNGELSITSSNEEVVTATIEGNKIRLQPVLPTGTSTITVTSGEIGNYNETTTTFTVTVELGILDITVNGYNGLYDEEAHSITVVSSGANITYATEENGVYSETNPTYTDVGTYTVWYKVEKYGYEVVVDSATINISPTNLGLALPKTEDTLVGTLIEQKTVQYQVINKGGELSVTSSNPDVATATITQDGVLTVTSGSTAGAVVITVTSGEKLPNYVESTARLELNVEVTCGYDSGQTWDFAYTGSKSDFIVPCDGTYKLEVWGAQGGSYVNTGGKGGFSEGTLALKIFTNLYVYVGGQGTAGKSTYSYIAPGGFNGGGNGGRSGANASGSAGGGATDIRIGTDSLNYRVIVAGGGGGAGSYSGGDRNGGAGGGAEGLMTGSQSTSQGRGGGAGTQTSGGATSNSTYTGSAGNFGSGGAGYTGSSGGYGGGGGGGGWYGGGSGGTGNSSTSCGGGGGGSGYVFTSSSVKPSGYVLDSHYYLNNAATYAGNTSFMSPTGSTETGHSGNGYARITLLSLD